MLIKYGSSANTFTLTDRKLHVSVCVSVFVTLVDWDHLRKMIRAT